ncbi:hypothetical protein Bca4012_031887 [Brassica carinata]
MVRDKVREDISRIERQLSTLSESFITFQTNVLESIQKLVRKLEVSSGQIPVSSSAQTGNRLNRGQGIQLDVPSENQTPHVIPEKMGLIGGQVIQPVIHTGNQTRRDSHEEMITDDPPDAILFSNQANTFAVDVLNGAQEIQSSIHTEYQTLRGGAHKSGAEDMSLTIPHHNIPLAEREKLLIIGKVHHICVSDSDDSVNDSMVRPVSDFAASPIDFPPESYSLSKEAQLEWFNENAFFERKESQKGNSFPAQSTNTNSSSQMISLKSKTSVIRLPKPQKTCFNEVKKRRNCRIARTLMIPKRFGSLLKSDPSLSEPGSPKVSCIGRVRSKRDRSRQNAETEIRSNRFA